MISGADMADCYSYGYLALHALEIMSINKTPSVGRILGYSLLAARQLVFAKIRRDRDRGSRLPLGTLSWGEKTHLDSQLFGDLDLLGRLAPLACSLASHLDDSTD